MDADAVFKALADPSRRRLLDMLHAHTGSTLSELCAGLDMRRQSVSQHLEILEAAGLVTAVRDGRRKLHYLNPVPIHEVRSRWIWKFEDERLDALDTIKQSAEEPTMTTPDYVYTTYIRATPERVWEALTDRELTSRFWGHAQVSDWAVGSRVDHVRTDDSGISDVAGKVVAVRRPHRLAFTFDDPERVDDLTFEGSLVTFDIESHEDIVKLTMTHTQIRSDEDRRSFSQGWPAILANLKTLLETGEVLPQAPWHFHAEEREANMAANE